MAYNQNIPQPTDKISTSQGQILANFQALNNIATQTAPYLLFPEQGSAPVTPVDTVALYSVQGLNSVAELSFQRESSSGPGINFTQYGQNQDATSLGTNGQGGYTILPSGIVLKWGSWTMTGSATSQVVTFPMTTSVSGQPTINSTIPGFGTLYNVSISVYNVTSNIAAYGSVSAANTANFTVVFPTLATYVIRYFAVGV